MTLPSLSAVTLAVLQIFGVQIDLDYSSCSLMFHQAIEARSYERLQTVLAVCRRIETTGKKE